MFIVTQKSSYLEKFCTARLSMIEVTSLKSERATLLSKDASTLLGASTFLEGYTHQQTAIEAISEV